MLRPILCCAFLCVSPFAPAEEVPTTRAVAVDADPFAISVDAPTRVERALTVFLAGNAKPLAVLGVADRRIKVQLPPALPDGSYRLLIHGLRDGTPDELVFTIGVVGPYLDETH
jgi:hypothetical protein